VRSCTILAVAAAVVAGVLADRLLQTAPFVSLFLCAILFAAWLGGAGPGLLAAGLSTLAFDYYFIPAADSFAFQAIPRLSLFAMTALFVIWLSAAQRRRCESWKSKIKRCRSKRPNGCGRNKAQGKPNASFR
jgi:K+-sensing histidine kinase KdpD